MTDPAAAVDPAAVVAEIRAEVERRRDAGDYPLELLRRLESEFTLVDEAAPLDALAHLETVRPLESTRVLTGRAVVTAKRALRRAIAWYIRPITEDQTRFNFGVVRRLQELDTRMTRIEAQLTALQGARAPGDDEQAGVTRR